MANLASPLTTYSDTTPQMRVITDYVSLIDPSDAPLVEALGGLDGAASKFNFLNWPGTNPEWLEDTLSPLALTSAFTADITTSSGTSMAVTDPNMFQVGHIFQVDSELMWISAISTSTLTVTRSFGGSSATHASTATATIVGMARLEGADSTAIGFTDRTSSSNYTQIFQKEIKVTRTQTKIQQYGIADEYNYQVDKSIPELMRLIERTLQYGQVKAGAAATPRAMAGYSSFISTNKVSGASLTAAAFENAVMSAYQAGGSGPWIAVCAPVHLQKIKNFYDSSLFLRVNPDETVVGMVVDTVRTPYGDVSLLLDRWQNTTIIPILDVKHAGLRTFDPFTNKPLAISGDYIKGETIGEFTFCLRQEKAHAMLTAYS